MVTRSNREEWNKNLTEFLEYFPVLLSCSDRNINFHKEFKNTLFETELSHVLNKQTN
jgi:hypothetical protein